MYRQILYKNLEKMIQTDKLKGKRIYVFGKNYPGFLIKDYLMQQGYQLSAFLDNNSKESLVEGIPITHPSDLSGKDAIILIVSQYFNEMCSQLEGMGYIRDEDIFRLVDLEKNSEEIQNILKDYYNNYHILDNKEVKNESLEILKYFKKICEENGITYYLCGGSLLGAVRHKGFIPWDDDIDISVPITHCKKLKDIIKEDAKYRILSQENEETFKWNYFQIYNPDIGQVSLGFGEEINRGLSVDIFPIYSLPDDPKECDRVIKENERLKNLIKYEYNHQVSRHGKEYLETRKKLMNLWEDIGLTETKRMMRTCVGAAGYGQEEFVSADAYKDTIMMEFCDDVFPVPAGYDEILTTFYGDYMKLPPEEKRRSHHTSIYYYREGKYSEEI